MSAIETEKTPRRHASRQRVDLAIDHVKEALAAVELGDRFERLWFDQRQPYFYLSQRGSAVGWFVKTKHSTRRIGDAGVGYKDSNHLNPREARQKAAAVFAELAAAGRAKPAPTPQKVWTWSELVSARLDELSGLRQVGRVIKYPSADTRADVRQAFGIDAKKRFDPTKRPKLVDWQGLSLMDLDSRMLMGVVRSIVHQRPREKFLTYAKSALSWAYSNDDLSGFKPASPWWTELQPPSPPSAVIQANIQRHEVLADLKAGFTVDHVGEFLVRHEAFCADKTGNAKVSPGIRWGIWWIALTANRRGSTTKLRREAVELSDPLGEPGWGTAMWDSAEMKGRMPFMMPLPPIALHAIEAVQLDWKALVNESHGHRHTTQWVFASTRRVQRAGVSDDRPTDIPVDPSSLADHLRSMRGRKDNGYEDVLKHLPAFTLHTFRAAATNFFENVPGLPPSASSAFLAHAPPTVAGDTEAMSRTTAKFYNITQKMPLKRQAMAAWSEAVMAAYYAAGGTWPQRYAAPARAVKVSKTSRAAIGHPLSE